MITTYIFDVGGVIFYPINQNNFTLMAEMSNLPLAEFRKQYEAFRFAYDIGEISVNEYWENVAPQMIPRNRYIAIDLDIPRGWLATPNKTTVDMLHKLRSAGKKLGLLSNMPQEGISCIANNYPWMGPLFDSVVFSYKCKMGKPDPAVFHKSLKELGSTPEESYFIDDTEKNVVAARELGLQALFFKGEYPSDFLLS